MVRINKHAILQALRFDQIGVGKIRLHRVGRQVLVAFAAAGLVVGLPIVFALAYLFVLAKGPLPARVTDANNVSMVLYDAFGEEIGIRGRHRRLVELEQIPDHTIAAFLAVEDRRFYEHDGVDLIGVARALRANFRAKYIVEGGSTITQQLVKNIYLDSEQTLRRKIEEAVLAVRLENRLSKEEILEEYLYTVYFGNNAYGIEAAAESYFRKSASELSVAESALLAGSIKAPGRYAPHLNPAYAKTRGRLVLGAMTETGSLSLLDAEMAAFELDALTVHPREPEPYGYFLDYAVAEFPADDTTQDIVQVHTTLHPQYQTIAEKALAAAMTDKAIAKMGVTQAALVAMRPTGEVIAMVGGTDYAASQFNRVTQAKRQPGSLFKAFVYDAAIRRGWRMDDLIVDSPLSMEISGKNDDLYTPANYNDHYYGLTNTRQAFAKSANSSALRLQEWAGRENVINAAKRAGLNAKLLPYASLGLGVTETTLIDITAAYAALASNHVVEPFVLRHDQPLQASYQGEPSPELLQLLYNNIQAGTGYAARLDIPSFGKTGTTQYHRDAWFVGFTDHLVVGVWVGNDDNKPMKKVTGGTLPATIWKSFLKDARKELAMEETPSRFTERPLLEIALDGQDDSTVFDWQTPRMQRVLGPLTLQYDGSLNVGGIAIFFDGIRMVSAYGAHHDLYVEIETYLEGRELVCELNRIYASCHDATDDVAEYVVENGWARTTYRAPRYLLQAEQRARDARKGLWADKYRYVNPRYDFYDLGGLTWQQRRKLERQRAAEARRVQQLQDQYRLQNTSVVVGRSAAGAEPLVSQARPRASQPYVQRGVVGSLATDTGL